jgi:hypothetical protein
MPSPSSVSSVLTRVPVNETGCGTEKRGRKGELEVTVRIERVSESVTPVDVIARKNVVAYDRTFAKQVLDAMAK